MQALSEASGNEHQSKEQLAAAIKELDKYKSVFGDASSSLPPDMQSLSKQLHSKDEEIQRLRLLDKQHQQAEAALYSEIDKLSAAWEALDRQVKSKVFDLAAMEEKVVKSGLEVR